MHLSFDQLVHQISNLGFVSTTELVNLLLVLDKDECRHCVDFVFNGDFLEKYVGKDEKYFLPTSFSSTSTFRKTTESLSSLDISSSFGAITLHGPHHVA